MSIKAEFVHIAPVSLTSDFPLRKILDALEKIKKPDLTIADVHGILADSFADFSEAHSALYFTKAKLLFDPDIAEFTAATVAQQTVRRNSFKVLMYLQLAKNRRDHSKGLATTWTHSVNPDDTMFLNTSIKPISALKLTIPNFLRDVQLQAEIQNAEFAAEVTRVFQHPEANTLQQVAEKKQAVEIDFQEFYEIVSLSNKVLTLENSKKAKLFISECTNSNIYFRSNFDVVIITRCKNCEIFIPGVKRITLIEHSNDLNVTIISRALHVSNVSDSIIHTYTCFEPQLLGETINVVLAPHNTNYTEVFDTLEQSGIPLASDFAQLFSKPHTFFTAQQFLDHKKNLFSVLGPENFENMILPKEFAIYQYNALLVDKRFLGISKEIESVLRIPIDQGVVVPILAPAKFKEVVLSRAIQSQKIKQLIKESRLTPEQQEKFLDAVQGHFREWLMTKPHSTGSLIRILNSLGQKF
jgi:hypothetical protein